MTVVEYVDGLMTECDAVATVDCSTVDVVANAVVAAAAVDSSSSDDVNYSAAAAAVGSLLANCYCPQHPLLYCRLRCCGYWDLSYLYLAKDAMLLQILLWLHQLDLSLN